MKVQDNFTKKAAHSRNAESVTFLYSWEELDQEPLTKAFKKDSEWQASHSSPRPDSRIPLQQVLQEYIAAPNSVSRPIERIYSTSFPSARSHNEVKTGE